LNIVESNRIIHKTSSKFDLQPQQTTVCLEECVYKENLIYILIPILQTEAKKKSMSKMGEDRDRVQTDLAGDGIRRRRQRTPPKGCRR